MVSIKHIAAKCGVSIATVSKALNNHSDVSEGTKRLVFETAKELGYLPNSQARALKTNKSYNLGVLFSEKAGSGLAHSFFASVLDSFKVEAQNEGYDITFICNNVGGKTTSCYDHCKYRGVDGVLIACADFYEKDITQLFDSDLPVIAIVFNSDKKLSVSSDNVSGIKKLVKYIYLKGHKKIAYIYGDSSQVTTIRLKTYLDTLKSLGIEPVSDYVKQSKYHDPSAVKELTEQMLKLYDPPTCIILPDDYAAVGAYAAAREAGLSIPDDISFAGYDGLLHSQILCPSLTTIKQNTSLIGKTAAELLIKLIKKEISTSATPPIIPGELIQGFSVKDLSQA
jgi:DNA-binding LacI/PurR family transcriptional regulator